MVRGTNLNFMVFGMAEAEEETRNEESRDQTPRPETDAERDAEAATPQTATSNQDGKLSENKDEAYSIFTTPQKRAIVCTASLCAFFSPITATIYFPALNVIAHDLGVSNSDINLTVTTYLVRFVTSYVSSGQKSDLRTPRYFKVSLRHSSLASPIVPVDGLRIALLSFYISPPTSASERRTAMPLSSLSAASKAPEAVAPSPLPAVSLPTSSVRPSVVLMSQSLLWGRWLDRSLAPSLAASSVSLWTGTGSSGFWP